MKTRNFAAGFLLLAGTCLSTHVWADETVESPKDAFILGEINVNAQQRPKNEITVLAPKKLKIEITDSTLNADAITAFDRQRLDDALNLMPGVNSGNTGGPRNERFVDVRGFDRFEVPLSIDGIRIYLPADNRLDLGRFLTTDVSEVQVAKGYVSVLDGPDGMGGAINLVTRKPTKPFEAEMQSTLNLGRNVEYGGYNVSGLLGTRRDKWYAQATYTRNDTDHWDLAGGYVPTPSQGAGQRDNSRTHDWRVNLKAGFTLNVTDEYSLSFTKQSGDKLTPFSTVDPIQYQRDWTWPWWDVSSLYFLSTTALGDAATIKTKAFYNLLNNSLDSFDNANLNTQTLPKSFNSTYADKAYGGSAQLDVRPIAGDTLSALFYYRRDQHDQTEQSFPSAVWQPTQTSKEDSYSEALQNVLFLSPSLSLTTGISYDWRQLLAAQEYGTNAIINYPLVSHAALNGQGRLAWKAYDGTELYTSISDRTRFPTLFERFSTQFGGAVSNPDLKPERAINYEIGASHQFGIVSTQGAIFASHLTDAIVSEPFLLTTCFGTVCTPNPVVKSFNAGRANYYGAEMSLNAKLLSNLSVGGNYTYTHRKLDNPGNPNVELTDVPTHKGFIYADWAPLRSLDLRPSADIASDRWTVNTAGTQYFRTGSYVNIGFAAEYTLRPGVVIGVGARNLLDQNYQLVDGFPEEGRSYYADLRVRY